MFDAIFCLGCILSTRLWKTMFGDVMLIFPALSAIFAGLLPIFGKLSTQNDRNSSFFHRAALRELSALAVALVALLSHLSTGCELSMTLSSFLLFAMSGFFEFAAWSAIFFSLAEIRSSTAAAIDKLTVPITLTVTSFATMTLPRAASLLSAVLVIVSVTLLCTPFEKSKYTIFAIFAAFATSISLILSDRALSVDDLPICGFFFRTLFSFFFASVASLFYGSGSNVSRETSIYSSLCGFCGGLSWLFCFISLTIFDTTTAVASVKLGVFLTIPLSALLFGFRPTKRQITAYVILLAGLLLLFA